MAVHGARCRNGVLVHRPGIGEIHRLRLEVWRRAGWRDLSGRDGRHGIAGEDGEGRGEGRVKVIEGVPVIEGPEIRRRHAGSLSGLATRGVEGALGEERVCLGMLGMLGMVGHLRGSQEGRDEGEGCIHDAGGWLTKVCSEGPDAGLEEMESAQVYRLMMVDAMIDAMDMKFVKCFGSQELMRIMNHLRNSRAYIAIWTAQHHSISARITKLTTFSRNPVLTWVPTTYGFGPLALIDKWIRVQMDHGCKLEACD